MWNSLADMIDTFSTYILCGLHGRKEAENCGVHCAKFFFSRNTKTTHQLLPPQCAHLGENRNSFAIIETRDIERLLTSPSILKRQTPEHPITRPTIDKDWSLEDAMRFRINMCVAPDFTRFEDRFDLYIMRTHEPGNNFVDHTSICELRR